MGDDFLLLAVPCLRDELAILGALRLILAGDGAEISQEVARPGTKDAWKWLSIAANCGGEVCASLSAADFFDGQAGPEAEIELWSTRCTTEQEVWALGLVVLWIE